MLESLQSFWDWFSPDAFSVGCAVVIAWWFTGMIVGWIFDTIRKT